MKLQFGRASSVCYTNNMRASLGLSNFGIVIIIAALSVGALLAGLVANNPAPAPTTPVVPTLPPVPKAPTVTPSYNTSQQQGAFEFVPGLPTPTLPLPEPPTATPGAPTGCTYPAQILDLSNWKLTLPIGSGSPDEIKQPALATYTIDPWFMLTPDCMGIKFRAHTASPVTTNNSNYPRSELREMTNNGTANASWSNTSGTHVMFIDEAITAVPIGKQHVVAGQIHDASDDVIVIRLEMPKLFVDINGVEGPTLDAAYTLGKRFSVKFVAANGVVDIFYNNNASPAYTLNKAISNSYFKAGVYTQSNCARETEYGSTCSDTNYGEVVIYNLWLQHF